ncbi:MAG: hypothetical protein ACKVHU_08275 [Acidimicrobiales bacterium]
MTAAPLRARLLVEVGALSESPAGEALLAAAGFAVTRLLPGAVAVRAMATTSEARLSAELGGALDWGDNLSTQRCLAAACAALDLDSALPIRIVEHPSGSWSTQQATAAEDQGREINQGDDFPGSWLVALLSICEVFTGSTPQGIAVQAYVEQRVSPNDDDQYRAEADALRWAASAIDVALARVADSDPAALRSWLSELTGDLRHVQAAHDELRHRYEVDLRVTRAAAE